MSKRLFEIITMDHAPAQAIPEYKTSGSAGMDIRSAVNAIILPYQRQLLPTGIKINLPENCKKHYEGQIRSRSGLAMNHGIIVLNAPGTIDADYKEEIQILLYNTSDIEYRVSIGDRIAQLVIASVKLVQWELVKEFRCQYSKDKKSARLGGFGSTGIK